MLVTSIFSISCKVFFSSKCNLHNLTISDLFIYNCFEFAEVKNFVIRFWLWINSLPADKIVDLSKFKAFVDDKINATEKLKFALGMVENIVGKRENAA